LLTGGFCGECFSLSSFFRKGVVKEDFLLRGLNWGFIAATFFMPGELEENAS